MNKVFAIIIAFAGLLFTETSAQNKVVLLDISLEEKSEYLKVSPNIFANYQDIVENHLGAKLIINEDQEIGSELLNKADVLIVLSTLSSTAIKKTRSANEISSIISFVKNGGKLIFFTDEDRRMNIEAFGANEIVRPFGMEFGSDLPMARNTGAISFVGRVYQRQV
jgi:hypothetical protein